MENGMENGMKNGMVGMVWKYPSLEGGIFHTFISYQPKKTNF